MTPTRRSRRGPVVVVGSLNADLVTRAPRLPRPGETVLGGSFQIVPGGKGGNQAAAAARLGAPVVLIGRVGDDAFGHLLREALRKSGVSLDLVRVDGEAATGTAQIVVAESGENAIVVAPGANERVSADDVRAAAPVWHTAAVVVAQLEVPLATVAATVQAAAPHAVPVILNAAPVRPLPRTLLDGVRWLVVNEVEAEQLSGCPVQSVADAVRAARALPRGEQKIVVTLGAAGAVLVDGDVALHARAPQVKVVDTTAAGDAFVGALATAVRDGLRAEDALCRAVAAGSLACTRLGAQPSLPERAAVDRLVPGTHAVRVG